MEEKRQMEMDEKHKIDLKRKELEGDLVMKSEILDNLKKDTENLKQTIKRQENELFTYRNMNEGKEEELSKLRGTDGRVNILRDRLKTIEDERDQSITEIERMRRDLENIRIKDRQNLEKMESLHSVIEEKEHTINRQEDKLKELLGSEVEVQELKNRNNLHLREEEVLNNTIERLREKVQNLNTQNCLYENTSNDQKVKFQDVDRQVWEKNRLVQNLEDELDALRKQVRESRSKTDEKHSLYNQSCEKLHLSELKVDELKDVLARENHKYSIIENELTELKQQNQLLDSEKSVGSESVDKLKMLVVQLEKNKDKLIFELQSSNEKVESTEREKKKLY